MAGVTTPEYALLLIAALFLIPPVSADSLAIERFGNKLELNENLTSVASSLTDTELDILHGGKITNENGTFEYKQTLILPQARVIYAPDIANISGLHVSNVPKDYLLFPKGSEGYRLKAAFSPALKTEHNPLNDGYLEGLQGKTVFLLGMHYNISAAHPARNSIALTLVNGSKTLLLNDSDTQSTATGGAVMFNGRAFSGVKADIKTSGDAGVGSGDDVYISSIEIFYSPGENVYVASGENASVVAALVEGQPHLFLDSFEVIYSGLTTINPETITMRSVSNNDYKLEFINKAGVAYSVPFLAQASSLGNIIPGDNVGGTVRSLNIFENQSISDEDSFLVSSNNYSRILQFKDVDPGVNNTGNMPDGAGKIKIKDTGSGDLLEVTYSNLQGDLVLDGNTYKVNVTADATTAALYVDLDGSGNNPATGTAIVNQIRTQHGATIQLGVRNSSNTVRAPGPGTYSVPGIAELGYNLSYVIFSSGKDEDNARTNITLVFGRNGDNEIDIVRVEGTDVLSKKVGNSFLYEDYIYNETPSGSVKTLPAYGYFLQWDRKSLGNDQDDITISYPVNQTTAKVYVTPAPEGAVLPPVEERVETFSFGAGTPINGARNPDNEITINVSYPALDSVEDTLSEGETKTYSVAEKDYEVTLDFVGSSQTKFTVNGQVTNALEENQQQALSDNALFSVMDIISQEFAGGARKVKFNITVPKDIALESCILDWNGTNESVQITSDGCIVRKPAVPGGLYTFRAFVEYSSGTKGISNRVTLKENSKPKANVSIVRDLSVSTVSTSSHSIIQNETSENINYSASLSTRGWNTLFIPTVAILGSFGMTTDTTQGWNSEYVLSTRGKLFNNYTLVYYNVDGTDNGWKLLMRGEWNGSDLRHVNNTNDQSYLINTTIPNLTFKI